MVTSRLTSKGQTTIPRSVRESLRLREGDTIEYDLSGDYVVLRKVDVQASIEDPFSTFDEWDSEADRRAYAKL